MSGHRQPVKPLPGDRALTARRTGRRGGLTVAINARALLDLRLKALLTQRELGKAAGCSTSYICELETGRYKPGIASLRALARALDCKVEDLMAPEEDEDEDEQGAA